MNQDVLKEKEGVVGEVKDLVNENGNFVICEYRGLTVAEISTLRRELTKHEAKANVYKNSLVSRALKDDYEDLENYLTGPNIYIFLKDPTNGSLKAISKFARRNDNFVIKGGVIDGNVKDAAYIKTLASLPSKEGLVSMLLSVLQAPMRNLAYSLSQVSEKK